VLNLFVLLVLFLSHDVHLDEYQILMLILNEYCAVMQMLILLFLVEQELPTLPEHLNYPRVFSGVRATRSLVLCVMFCRSLFVLFSFFFWPLRVCPSKDLRILITPLVSSNSSSLRFYGILILTFNLFY